MTALVLEVKDRVDQLIEQLSPDLAALVVRPRVLDDAAELPGVGGSQVYRFRLFRVRRSSPSFM